MAIEDHSTPPLYAKLDSVTEALKWASGTAVVWRRQKDAPRAREANRPWLEVMLMRIRKIGYDEDIRDYNPETMNQSVQQIGRREIYLQITARSRRGEHEQSAWFLAERARTRLNSSFAKSRWLHPAGVGLADTTDVIDMESGLGHDNRIEDVAHFEVHLNAFVSETDAAMAEEYIETVEVSSNFQSGGDSIDASLQLDKEVM